VPDTSYHRFSHVFFSSFSGLCICAGLGQSGGAVSQLLVSPASSNKSRAVDTHVLRSLVTSYSLRIVTVPVPSESECLRYWDIWQVQTLQK
jgi:hypothetical protein